MKIVGAGVNALANARSYRNQMKNLRQQEHENRNWYDRRYNEKATERADMVARNEQAQQYWAQQMAQHQGTAAVMGGTNAQLAAQKNAAAAGYAQEQGQAMQRQEVRKDTIENAYNANKTAIQNQMLAMEQNRAKGIAQSTGQAIQAGSEMLSIPDKEKLA